MEGVSSQESVLVLPGDCVSQGWLFVSGIFHLMFPDLGGPTDGTLERNRCKKGPKDTAFRTAMERSPVVRRVKHPG